MNNKIGKESQYFQLLKTKFYYYHVYNKMVSSRSRAKPMNIALYNRVKAEAKRKYKVWPSAYASGWLVQEYKKRGGKYTISKSSKKSRNRKGSKKRSKSRRRKSRSRKRKSRSHKRKSSRKKSRSSKRKSPRKKSRRKKYRSRRRKSRRS